jgi:phage-related protein
LVLGFLDDVIVATVGWKAVLFTLAGVIGGVVTASIVALTIAMTKLTWTAMKAGAAMIIANGPAILMGVGIAALAAAVVLLIDEWQTFQNGDDSFIFDLIDAFPELANLIGEFQNGLQAVTSWLEEMGGQFGDQFKELGTALIGLLEAAWPILSITFQVIADGVKAAMPFLLWLAGVIVTTLTAAIETIANILTWFVAYLTWMVGVYTNIFNYMATFADTITGAIESSFSWLFDSVIGALQTLGSVFTFVATVIYNTFDSVFMGIYDTFIFVGDAIGVSVAALVTTFTGAWDAIGNAFNSVFGAIESKITTVSNGVQGMMEFLGLNTLVGNVGSVVNSPSVQSAAGAQGLGASAAFAAPPNALVSAGALGAAAGVSTTSSNSVTHTTQITAPITITSTDPTKSGESVREELNKANKTSIRNGQSAVAI